MRTIARAVYRTRQGLLALWPRIGVADLTIVDETLNDELAALFFGMERRDQRHALEVARRLMGSGVEELDLVAAALLHDCGKGLVPVWMRVLKVLSPGLLRQLAREGGGWRGAAHRLHDHASIGAQLAASAGASGLTVRLIGETTSAEDEGSRALLQAADDAS